jgi:hypothetical protein
MTSSDRTLIFLHIPKTAGTTLYEILDHAFRSAETLTFDGYNHPEEIPEFIRAPEGKRARYNLIKGHLDFGLHRYIPRDSTYVTLLREPISRIVSFYDHARRHPQHYLYPVLKNGGDLKKILKTHATTELFNQQTRMIAGDEWCDLNRPVDAAALERAKDNMRKHFAVVGLTEEFDASLLLIRRAASTKMPFYRKRNVAPTDARSDALDAETRGLVCEANTLDVELYKFGRELFNAQRRAAGMMFEAELRSFQLLNRGREAWLRARDNAKQVLRKRRAASIEAKPTV